MTVALSGLELGARIEERFPGAVSSSTKDYLAIKNENLLEVCAFLRDDPQLDFKYLSTLTAVDRLDHFEVVYHLQSIRLNQMVVVKAEVWDRENAEVPSVVSVWVGAHLQEREAYDLMGIRFLGHPDLRRIFLWEGFAGYPLRKDWLSMPGGYMPGLERFPGEPGGKLEGRG